MLLLFEGNIVESAGGVDAAVTIKIFEMYVENILRVGTNSHVGGLIFNGKGGDFIAHLAMIKWRYKRM